MLPPYIMGSGAILVRDQECHIKNTLKLSIYVIDKSKDLELIRIIKPQGAGLSSRNSVGDVAFQ